MRVHPSNVRTILLAVLTVSAAAAPAHDGPHTLPSAAAAPAKAAEAAAQTDPHIGKAESSRWTPTTYEAATSDVHKKVLEGGKVASVTGEVVDVSCYMQLGKRGEAHVACGTKCIANGMPIGLVDAAGDLFILFAEEHHPRRDGGVDLKQVFLPHLAKTVTVTGMLTEMKGYRALFVQAAEVGGAVTVGAPKTPEPAAVPKPADAPAAPKTPAVPKPGK